MSYLIMRRGPNQGNIYPFLGDEITIGRGTKNDIVIDDNDVSRDHVRFVKVAGGYELHDLSSSNGTFVNGQPVEGVWLIRSHCIIELGDSITLEYRPGDPDDDFTPPAGIDTTNAPRYFLVMTNTDQEESTVYPLEDSVIKVGRSTANDIVIVEPELSRNHFRLTLTERGYVIEDLGSTNGTSVNGERINQPRLLYTDDLITIGTMVQFQLTKSAESFTPVKTSPLNNHATAPLGQRKTSASELAQIAGMMQNAEPTIGTGLDHNSLKDQVLITYAREDWEQVIAPLVDALYTEKVDTWVDQYLTEGSSDWLVATEQARLECWMLLVVISPKAMQSDLVQKNWRHFQNREKPIVLLVYEPVERMPIGARKLTRIQYNPGVPDIAFQQVAAEIKKLKPQD